MSTDEAGAIAKFYDDRFARAGSAVGSVGWSSVESQTLRFQTLFRGIDVRGKRILDVGCGMGDLVSFLTAEKGIDFDYTGVDVSDSLISVANQRHRGARRDFIKADYLEKAFEGFDIVVQSGAATLKVAGGCNRASAMMVKMCQEAIYASLGNFLSSVTPVKYRKNCYFERTELLSKAKELSPDFRLLEDYGLNEYTLQIFSTEFRGRPS